MANERLKLVVEDPKRYNEDLPGNQAFTLQRLYLADETEIPVVTADAYTDPRDRYYSVYWNTHTSPGTLIELVEETIRGFEHHSPRRVHTVGGKDIDISTPKAIDWLWRLAGAAHLDVTLPPVFGPGVMLTSKDPDGRGRRLMLSLQRPLSWNRFERLARQKPISFARIDTKVGSFCITRYDDDCTSFGVLAQIAQPAGFVRPLELTAEEEISHDEAMNFLSTVVGLFETR